MTRLLTRLTLGTCRKGLPPWREAAVLALKTGYVVGFWALVGYAVLTTL